MNRTRTLGLRITAALAAAVAIISLASAQTSEAASFTVTRPDDPSPNGCGPADCSLREAVIAANAAPGADSIALPAGTYALSIAGRDEDQAAKGDLDITDGVTITGSGTGATTIDGNGAATDDRVFEIASGTTVSVSDLTVTDGGPRQDPIQGGGGFDNHGTLNLDGVAVTDSWGGADGGGIRNTGDLNITDSTISGNIGGGLANNSGSMNVSSSVVTGNRRGNSAGGIYNAAWATLTDVTVSDNEAPIYGGGIMNVSTMLIVNSTISGNAAYLGHGGGIYTHPDTYLTLSNVTISGNSAGVHGGGIFNAGGTVSVLNATITGNAADSVSDDADDGEGGGMHNAGGDLSFKNTIVAGNSDPTSNPDCFGNLSSGGHNLVQQVSPGCNIAGDTSGNITGQDPLLGALDDNGGPTQTHALADSSPAIDEASGDCPPPASDQRGIARPQGVACDIGAFERSGPPAPTPSPTPGPGGHGDTDCDEDVDSVDSLMVLRHTAGLSDSACIAAGDVDCDSDQDSVDALGILRHVAALPPLTVPPSCPPIGQA